MIDDTVVTIVDVKGRKIILGVEAPIDIAVHRFEVAEQIKAFEEKRKHDCQE